jgi:hypothetical protein
VKPLPKTISAEDAKQIIDNFEWDSLAPIGTGCPGNWEASTSEIRHSARILRAIIDGKIRVVRRKKRCHSKL